MIWAFEHFALTNQPEIMIQIFAYVTLHLELAGSNSLN